MTQEEILQEQLQSASELVEKGDNAYQSSDYISALDSYHQALVIFSRINIVYPESIDTSSLQGKIESADQKLGLHIVEVDNKFGFADKNGNIVIPCKWSDIGEFSEGLSIVKDEHQLCGFMNYYGELVIPCVYKDAYSFLDGMACVESNTENDFDWPYTFYIDHENYYIASDFELLAHQIKAVYKASVLASFGKYKEAAESIQPALGTLDSNPMMRLLKYYYWGEEYNKLIERCRKILKFSEHSELCVMADIALADCYEYGQGVEADLMIAFNYYNAIRFENNISDDDYNLVEEFLDRHPELKELPEVQNSLNITFDDEEDY